jgi:hypothetical protein
VVSTQENRYCGEKITMKLIEFEDEAEKIKSKIDIYYNNKYIEIKSSLSDILCKWQNITRTEPVLFRTQWRTGLTPAPNPVSA